MPSHLHLILKPENKAINEILQDFGSFSAHTILHQLRMDQRDDLLKFFHEQRRDARHQHSIWQDIQAKNVYSHEFFLRKWNIVIATPYRKTGDLSKTGRITNTQAYAFMTMETLQSFQLLMLMSG